MPLSHAEHVAAEVRAELARQHKTQVELAAALGLSQAAVSRRLLGHVPFDLVEVERTAAFLEVPISVLAGAA